MGLVGFLQDEDGSTTEYLVRVLIISLGSATVLFGILIACRQKKGERSSMQFSPLISDYLYIPISFALIGAAISIFTDIKTGKIKNFITFPLILIGLSWSLIFGGPKLFLINFLLSIFIGFASCLGGRLGAGDIKLNMGIAACLQPVLNVLFLAFFFVTRLVGAIFARLKIHNFSPLSTLKAMKAEIYMELVGVKNAGQISHGRSVRHIGAPIIFAALVFTLIRAYAGGLLT